MAKFRLIFTINVLLICNSILAADGFKQGRIQISRILEQSLQVLKNLKHVFYKSCSDFEKKNTIFLI